MWLRLSGVMVDFNLHYRARARATCEEDRKGRKGQWDRIEWKELEREVAIYQGFRCFVDS